METISNVAYKIFKVEKKYNLFEKKINGVYIWKIVRFALFNEILRKKKMHEQSQTKVLKCKKIIVENLFESIKKKKKGIKNAFFVSERLNKEKKEIYSYKTFEEDLENSEIIYPILMNKQRKNQNINYINTENINYLLMFGLKILNSLNNSIKKEDRKFLEKIKKELCLKLSLDSIKTLNFIKIDKEIKSFKFMKIYYVNFIKKRGYKKIYLVCSYGREPLIAAAQELGIEVIEFQHGTMGKYHEGYSFPFNDKVPYFPDKIYGFSKFWYKNTPLPIKEENFIVKGYPYLYEQLKNLKKQKKSKNNVVFISQGTIGDKLCEKAVEFSKENPEMNVIIRLHPGEFARWKKEYIVLFQNKNLKNLKILDNNEKTLYDCLSESLYVVGAYSTALYEALEIGCKIQLLDLPGIEHVEGLINIGINVVKDNDKIEIEKFEGTNIKFFN